MGVDESVREMLPHDLSRFARETPDRPAVVMASSGESLSFGELNEQSSRVADLLWDLGLRRGDHVAVLLENQLEFFSVYWAAIRSGLYLTAVSPFLTVREATYILANSEARVLVVSHSRLGVSAELPMAELPALAHLLVVGSGGGLPEGHSALADAVAAASHERPREEPLGRVMLYSSGTTGRPKGIKRPLADQPFGYGGDLTRTLPGLFGVGTDTVYLSSAPLYHLAASVYIDGVNANGGTVVVMERFDAATALQLIETHRVTLAQFVPTMLVRILKLPAETRNRFDLSSLRTLVHGAGPCPPSVKEQLIEWLGPIVWEYYGGTEDNGNTVISSEEWLEHRGSVGRPLAGTAVHICGEDGRELTVGETGVIYLESIPARPVFEYHGDPGASAASRNPQHPQWTTLADVGHVDSDGYLYLTDRMNFTIVSGGVNVYPREIEDVLTVHPDVADVAVIGVPDEEFGEVVKAIVQPQDPAAAGDELAARLISYARENLAHYKCPRSIDFVESLPRLPTGKLHKHVLIEQYRSPSNGS